MKALHGSHQSAQKYTPMDVRPLRMSPVGRARPVCTNRSHVEYPCPSWTDRTGPKMSNQKPVLVLDKCESDGPRPPGLVAGVTCQESAPLRAIAAIAFVMAALIATCRSAVGVHTAWV